MSGLRKAKEYDWKDSNMALFGTDADRKVKKESAETEPAWNGAGQNVGLQIWRIEKFKVKHTPKEDYGSFYNGDSYIILNTYTDPGEDELKYDVHFWIGAYSTQDEYGTAAYKTVELDTLLDDKPVQHREVMNHEGPLFKSYFKSLSLLKGGAASGFRHVTPTEYKTRLLHVHGDKKNVVFKEIPVKRSSLKSEDVYIIDDGLTIYQWNGRRCNKDEKFKTVQYLQMLKGERSKAKTETLDEAEISSEHPVYDVLEKAEAEAGNADAEDEEDAPADESFTGKLLKLSDAGGKMACTLVSEGSLPRSSLDPNDVFIVDTGKECFVWIGSRASPGEKQNGLTYAHNYLKDTRHPFIPVTVVREGSERKEFLHILD